MPSSATRKTGFMSHSQRWARGWVRLQRSRSCTGRPADRRSAPHQSSYCLVAPLHSREPAKKKGNTTMDLGLKGRNAVVLGGTRGIGRAIADTLAAEGSGVAVCARNADQIATAVAELKDKGAHATGASVDITDGDALRSWIVRSAQ